MKPIWDNAILSVPGRVHDNLLSRLRQRFGTINTQVGVLTAIFRKIEPFGGRKRGRPAQVRLEQVIADAFAVLETEIAAVGAQVSLPETATQVTVDQAEIQEVIVNLLQNSLYWLRQVPQDHRKVAVCVRRNSADEVEIVFSDSGPGVKAAYRDYIFDPYFSTKPHGVGLGLTIAGEIINEYYAGDTGVAGQWPSTRGHLSHHTAYTGMTWLPTIWQLLFVDDDPDFCRQVQEFLDGETIPPDDRLQVKTLNDFGDALNELETYRFDLLILDVRLGPIASRR